MKTSLLACSVLLTGAPSFGTGECPTTMTKDIEVLSSQKLSYGSHFVKAASGVVFADGFLYVIQDSSRYLAKLAPTLDTDIEFFELAPAERIAELEDPTKPYEEFRRDRRADFEAITALPDGRLLILGSGYDAHKIGSKNPHYRNVGILFDTKTNHYTELNLESFYQHLLERSDFVGVEHNSLKPRLNIEGVSIIDGQIAFFHRSNFAKNRHDAMIVFELVSWLNEVSRATSWSLKEKALTRFDFGSISWNGQHFPITLNDAFYQDGELFIPIACETDSVVDGKDIDGEVIWTGIARISPHDKLTTLHRFNDSRLPKVEGITADAGQPGHFFLVHDVDCETSPSLLSRLNLN